MLRARALRRRRRPRPAWRDSTDTSFRFSPLRFPMRLFYAVHLKKEGRSTAAPYQEKLQVGQAFAGVSPRVKPGAGRSSGRTTLGSVLGAACVGGGGGSLSGSGLPS